MNGTGEGRRRFFFLLAPLMLGAIAIPAARSDAADAAKPTAAQVADGLKAVQHAADEAAEYAAKDKAKAQKEWDEAHEAWQGFEDAIRDNDKDAYIAFEDAIDALKVAAKAGDGKKAEEAAEAIGNASKAYLAKFPGDAAAAQPAPAPTPAAKPAPAPVPDAPAPAAKPAPAPGPDASAAAGRTAAGVPAPAPAPDASAAAGRTAAAAPAPAPAAAAAAQAAPASTLARTGGGSSALAALAGAAFGLGGLAVIGGARRRRTSPTV